MNIADLPLLRTLFAIPQKSWETSFWEVMNSCFIRIWKFGSFKNPFSTITSLSELYFRFRIFILLVQAKKVISMNYSSYKSRWKPWRCMGLDLILSMRYTYINSNINLVTKLTVPMHKSSGFTTSYLEKRLRFVFDLCIGIKKVSQWWNNIQEGYWTLCHGRKGPMK